MENRVGFALAAAAAAFVAGGCGGGSKSAKTGGDTQQMGASESSEVRVPRVDPSLCDTEGKKVATFDLNHDNKPDVWKLYKTVDEGGTSLDVLTCKQVDLDHDGRKDYVITYDANGNKLTEEFDFDFDGRFDARHYFDAKTGRVYLVERDSDYDHKPDIWEKYTKDGVIESVRRDRNADGKPDVWEQYDAGSLTAILWDDDFDGRVDRKDEAKKAKAAPTPAPADGAAPDGAQPGGDEPAPAQDGAPAGDDAATAGQG